MTVSASVAAPPAPSALSSRFLALPGADAPGSTGPKARALRVLVPFTFCCELFFDQHFALGLPFALGLVAIVAGRGQRVAAAFMSALLFYVAVTSFPILANHFYLELLFLSMCALLDPDDEREQELLVQGARWLVVAVLFWSGAKKCMYGTYFQGEYFAFVAAVDPRFSDFLRPLLGGEIERLQSYAQEVGTGPYRVAGVRGALLSALSNGIWVGEVMVPLLLLWRRAQPVAWVLAIVLMFGIELVAREVFFGLMFSSVILSFAAAPIVHRAMPWIVGFQLLLVALSLLGLAPELTS